MQSEELLALLGSSSADARVESALVYFNVRNRPEVKVDEESIDGPVVGTQSWVKNSRAGIEFGFDDEAAWIGLDETEFGKRPMLLTQIYFYGEHQGVKPYQGPLPFGLKLLDDRATARRKFEALESTRHSHLLDTWDAPEARITVSYLQGGTGIDFILCMLREPALPPLPYKLVPVPAVTDLVTLLGCAADDPDLRRLLDPLGYADRNESIAESGEADFRNPYGLMLYFAQPKQAVRPVPGNTLLSTITFLRERELDARGWPGALPCGLHFDDSPERVIQKMGRPPDAHDDDPDDFSGYIAWNEPDFTLHVFYSSIENRVMRVSACAPGLSEPRDAADNEAEV